MSGGVHGRPWATEGGELIALFSWSVGRMVCDGMGARAGEDGGY